MQSGDPGTIIFSEQWCNRGILAPSSFPSNGAIGESWCQQYCFLAVGICMHTPNIIKVKARWLEHSGFQMCNSLKIPLSGSESTRVAGTPQATLVDARIPRLHQQEANQKQSKQRQHQETPIMMSMLHLPMP